jgi:hypothetical protein
MAISFDYTFRGNSHTQDSILYRIFASFIIIQSFVFSRIHFKLLCYCEKKKIFLFNIIITSGLLCCYSHIENVRIYLHFLSYDTIDFFFVLSSAYMHVENIFLFELLVAISERQFNRNC